MLCDSQRKISNGLRELIFGLMEKDPLKRATIEELRDNEWLNEGCKTRLNAEEYFTLNLHT